MRYDRLYNSAENTISHNSHLKSKQKIELQYSIPLYKWKIKKKYQQASIEICLTVLTTADLWCIIVYSHDLLLERSKKCLNSRIQFPLTVGIQAQTKSLRYIAD